MKERKEMLGLAPQMHMLQCDCMGMTMESFWTEPFVVP